MKQGKQTTFDFENFLEQIYVLVLKKQAKSILLETDREVVLGVFRDHILLSQGEAYIKLSGFYEHIKKNDDRFRRLLNDIYKLWGESGLQNKSQNPEYLDGRNLLCKKAFIDDENQKIVNGFIEILERETGSKNESHKDELRKLAKLNVFVEKIRVLFKTHLIELIPDDNWPEEIFRSANRSEAIPQMDTSGDGCGGQTFLMLIWLGGAVVFGVYKLLTGNFLLGVGIPIIAIISLGLFSVIYSKASDYSTEQAKDKKEEDDNDSFAELDLQSYNVWRAKVTELISGANLTELPIIENELLKQKIAFIKEFSRDRELANEGRFLWEKTKTQA